MYAQEGTDTFKGMVSGYLPCHRFNRDRLKIVSESYFEMNISVEEQFCIHRFQLDKNNLLRV